jgi:hypothetical protein
MNNSYWLTTNLKQQIRATFEPRYERELSQEEVIEIAENLEAVTEEILKLKWRQKYAKTI